MRYGNSAPERLRSALAAGGSLLLSTPISPQDLDEHPGNPCHVREWGFTAFQVLVARHFLIEEVCVQLYRPRLARLRHHLSALLVPPRAANYAYMLRLLALEVGQRLWPRPGYPYQDALQPEPWDARRHPLPGLGRAGVGYQLLRCRKP